MSCVCEQPRWRDENNIAVQCMVYYSYGKTRLVGGCNQEGVCRPAGSPCAGAVCLMLANARATVAVNHCRTDEFLGCVCLRMFLFIKCVCNITPTVGGRGGLRLVMDGATLFWLTTYCRSKDRKNEFISSYEGKRKVKYTRVCITVYY